MGSGGERRPGKRSKRASTGAAGVKPCPTLFGGLQSRPGGRGRLSRRVWQCQTGESEDEEDEPHVGGPFRHCPSTFDPGHLAAFKIERQACLGRTVCARRGDDPVDPHSGRADTRGNGSGTTGLQWPSTKRLVAFSARSPFSIASLPILVTIRLAITAALPPSPRRHHHSPSALTLDGDGRPDLDAPHRCDTRHQPL